MQKTYKPGQIVEQSGQANLVGPRGAVYPQQVTVTRGEPTPPTPRPNMSYRLTDLTIHRKK